MFTRVLGFIIFYRLLKLNVQSSFGGKIFGYICILLILKKTNYNANEK